jgi:hypothetical protein
MAKRKSDAVAVKATIKQSRQRSPNYPAIDLEKALERAEVLYKNAKTHYVSVGLAQAAWGYKALSSIADQAVAALRSFGLVEVEGEGAKREIRVSDMARRIILNSPERGLFLQHAALSPPIHKALWDKYGEIGLPADHILRSHLVFDLKFNEGSVDTFIAEFRATLAFAKITSDDTIQSAEGDPDDLEFEPQEGFNVTVQPPIDPKMPPIQPPKPGYSEFPLYFPNSRKGVLQIPAFTSKQDYTLLKRQMDHVMELMKAISGLWDSEQSESDEPAE